MSLVAVFADADALAARVAGEMAARLTAQGGRLVLGCPAGRSPLPAYRAFGQLAQRRRLDLSQVHLVLMDEYVFADGDGWRWCDADAHYSCRGYAEREIRAAWNKGLPAARRLPAAHLHAPDPNAPEAYEQLIADLGGIDLFLLASGASDGHVGFNPPGTPASARCRVLAMAEATRRDNVATFSASLDEIPTHGVTVGSATIAGQAKSALMILTGLDKRQAFARIAAAQAYDPQWPATIIHECADARVFADGEAAGRAEASLP